jgi:hypothetical protein
VEHRETASVLDILLFYIVMFFHHNRYFIYAFLHQMSNFVGNPIKDCLLDFHDHSLPTLRGYLYG